MTIYVRRMRRKRKSFPIRCVWLLAGSFFTIIGVILGYMPLVPVVYGLAALVAASLCFAQASAWCERHLGGLPLIGRDLVECRTTGVSDSMRRKFVFVTTVFMASLVYVNPGAWQTILWYVATIPLIHIGAYLWNKKLRS